MIESQDLQLVLAIAREGSLAAASRSLNVTASAISQRLSALEERLGLRIAERSGGTQLSLTAEGELLAERGKSLLISLDELGEELTTRKGVIAGHLQVVTSLGFGRERIAPLLGAFQKKHPEITVDLRLTDQLGKLPSVNWDLIIRVGPLQDSSLKMITLAENRRVLCAAPDYLDRRGKPEHPKSLMDHHCLAIREDNEDVTLWRFQKHEQGRKGQKLEIRIKPTLACNDGEAAKQWALSGRGILLRSEWSVREDLKAGRLIEILPDWSSPDAPIVALTRGPSTRTAKLQTLIAFLRDEITDK